MIGYNFHTHTYYSDGRDTPEAFVRQAIALGMKALGFSEHSPLPFDNKFSIKEKDLKNYAAEVRQLAEAYQDRLDIFLSIEMDYIPGLSENYDSLRQRAGLDYVIGSVHLVGSDREENLWFTDGPDVAVYDAGLQQFYGGDIRRAVKSFYDQTNEMIETQQFDVIGHWDKIKMHNQNRYFTEDEVWYKKLALETLELIDSKGLIAEVNTRGLYKKRSDSLYPSQWLLRAMNERQVPVIISSDAHHPSELMLEFDIAVRAVKDAGYRSVLVFGSKGWQEKPLV
ncbi:MAG: histidinol-phosphatase [Bacteroidia bacterium]|jgi:histidinol-phosphatase (PHP family)|nr:histidinol-phosphatase [Bacteroidia bacterium]